jgi:hypothetical protein
MGNIYSVGPDGKIYSQSLGQKFWIEELCLPCPGKYFSLILTLSSERWTEYYQTDISLPVFHIILLQITKYHTVQLLPSSSDFLLLPSKYCPFHSCNKPPFHVLLTVMTRQHCVRIRTRYCCRHWRQCERHMILDGTETHLLRNQAEVKSESKQSSMYTLIWIALLNSTFLNAFSASPYLQQFWHA